MWIAVDRDSMTGIRLVLLELYYEFVRFEIQKLMDELIILELRTERKILLIVLERLSWKDF